MIAILFTFVALQPIEPVGELAARITFLDHSSVAVKLQAVDIQVTTRFGPLRIPVAQIESIQVGVHHDAAVADAIKQAVADLNSDQHKARDEATKTLIGVGARVYPDIHPLLASKNEEVRKRAKMIIDTLKEKGGDPKDLKESADDAIKTRGFVVVGRITNPHIAVTSKYFGETKLLLRDIGLIRFEVARTPIVINAGKSEWQATGVRVQSGTTLVVAAEGQVDLWPQQPGQNMVGPNGFNQNGSGSSFAAGALIGKIGNGQEFLIGDRYSKSVGGEGELSLKIVQGPWGDHNQVVGQYKTTVEIR